MTFKNTLFANNDRIKHAAVNAPPMRHGESDHQAVRILQNALIGVGSSTMRRSIRADGTLDGDFGSETTEAVKNFQKSVGQGKGDGIVGKNTLAELDARAPHNPVSISITPAPRVTPRAESPLTTTNSNTVRLPNSSDLLREYQKFHDVKGKPCQQGVNNQCAVRMSIALMRCNIGFHFDNPNLKYTHSGKHRSCGIAVPHNTGAQRLFDHLKTIWTFQKFSKSGSASKTPEQISAQIAGKPGIIFFKDCFTRKGSSTKVGDHIDYWDGSLIMNDRLSYSEPEETSPGEVQDTLHLFRKTKKEIWFLQIS